MKRTSKHPNRPCHRGCDHRLEYRPYTAERENAEFFIRFLTDKDDLVLDPFAGSNTTGFAAEKLKRRWFAIELDAGYVETSEVRFRPEMINEARSYSPSDSPHLVV